VRDEAFEMAGSFHKDMPAAQLVLTRPSGGGAQIVPLDLLNEGPEVRFSCRIPLADVVDGFDFDDPLTQRTTWEFRLDDGSESLLVPTGLDHAVSVVHDSLLLRLTRNSANSPVLHVSPVQFAADQAETRCQRLLVRGPVWDGTPPRTLVWRRFPEDHEDSLEMPCETSSSSRRWSAVVDLDDLMSDRTASRLAHDGQSPTRWTLFASTENGCSHAVLVDEFLAGRLPIEVSHQGRTARLLPDGGCVRVAVP
jgi:CDP-glycerol glycerophosphotransferase